MTDNRPDTDATGSIPAPEVSLAEYMVALRTFDGAVCEARAVSQACSGRMVDAHVSYGTHVFARICSHATSFVRAAPRSRWVSSDHDLWDFSTVAGHARSIIEGYLLFIQLVRDPTAPGESEARVNVMHLNDCTKRIGLLEALGHPNVTYYRGKAEEIRGRLRANPSFRTLPEVLRNRLLTGRYLTIRNRDEQLDALGWDRTDFNAIWDVLSQYTHVLPFSFYSMEPNGRGTGVRNDADLGYIYMALNECTGILGRCLDRMVELFADVAPVRKGSDSKFSPGPRRNLPRHWKRGK